MTGPWEVPARPRANTLVEGPDTPTEDLPVRSMKLLSAGIVTALAVAAPAAAGNTDHKNKLGGSEPQTFACGDNDQVVFNGDEQLWPPNHKYAPYAIEAIGGDGDEDITLTTRVTHDEYVEDFLPEDETSQPGEEEVGSGHTVNDASPFFASNAGSGAVTNTHEIRSERSGRGDGRTYTFSIDATFDGQDCDVPDVLVSVPHDMRSDNAPAKEDKTDSTGPDQG